MRFLRSKRASGFVHEHWLGMLIAVLILFVLAYMIGWKILPIMKATSDTASSCKTQLPVTDLWNLCACFYKEGGPSVVAMCPDDCIQEVPNYAGCPFDNTDCGTPEKPEKFDAALKSANEAVNKAADKEHAKVLYYGTCCKACKYKS